MATALDALALPRCSALPSLAGGPSPAAGRRGFAQFRGLRVAPILSARSLRSPSSVPSFKRASRVVCEAQDTAVSVAPATEQTWRSLVLDSDLPVLVEFWAPWCGPCRMIHPIVDDLAKEYAGKVKFYKVNTDDNPTISTQYGIRSIPTVIMFKSGEKKEAIIGAVPKSTLATCVEKYL